MNDAIRPYRFNEFVVRADMVEALWEYVHQGVPLGDFLRAVVCNDLVEACGRADDGNVRNMPAFAAYLYNEMPQGSWGSAEAYERWIGRRTVLREQDDKGAA